MDREMVTDTEATLGSALFSAAFKDRAFATYAAWRASGPVTRVAFPSGEQIWLIVRFDEASEVLKNHAQFSNDLKSVFTPEEYNAYFQEAVVGLSSEEQEMALQTDTVLSRNLLSLDPPDHSRLRRLVAIPFTPRYIAGLQGRIEAIAAELLERVESRVAASGQRTMELIDDYAYPLPLTVIAEMLGIPDADRDRFRLWSEAAVAFNPSDPVDPVIQERLVEFIEYLRALVALKREQPADDLLSGLVLAESEGDKLSEDELLSMMFLLIVAGHETTVNLIGNGTLALFEHPEEFARLRQSPELLRSAIEEMLRCVGPVELSLSRWVRNDVEFGGEQMKRGDQLMVVLASANRDERRFPDPDRFDISREPNRHLAFGSGIHSCLGATLARLEAQVAFKALFDCFPDIELDGPRDALVWKDGTFLRGLTRLPVRF